MKAVKTTLLVLLVGLIIIQFFRPAQNKSAAHSPNDIAVIYNEPDDVRTILNKACNDCHSNNTRYPWYNNIQPVAWWLDKHVKDGKRELNFDEVGSYSLRRQYHKMEEVADMVKDGEMPLSSYTLIHTDAKLTNQEKTILIDWANSIKATMKATYPADSLIRKK